MKTVHCIGDGHVSIFNGSEGSISLVGDYPYSKDSLSNFRTYNIGSCLACLASTEGHQWNKAVNYIVKNLVKKDEYVLLSFGQVDTASHILKQSQIQNRTIEEISKEYATQYYIFTETLKEYCEKIIIYGPVTAGNMVVTDHPFRNKLIAAKAFTNCLLEKKDNDIIVLPLYDKIIDKEDQNRVRDGIFYDQTHLSAKTFLPIVIEELRKLLD